MTDHRLILLSPEDNCLIAGARLEAGTQIEIEGGTDTQRRVFTTALYHATMTPTTYSDVNGDYRGPDNAVHRAQGFEFHSTWSLWDVYRAQQPLMVLLQPQRSVDFVQSLIAAREASPFGILPVWAYQGLETWCMIGYHAVPVIADAYVKGIRGFDAKAGLDAMVASATYAPYGGLGEYMQRGYVPIDKEPEGASKTLEYAYDDWTIAQMAKVMGRGDVAATFAKRAGNWRNAYDANVSTVCAFQQMVTRHRNDLCHSRPVVMLNGRIHHARASLELPPDR